MMEFMQAFPDDAACLDWLFRQRHASDGAHAFCPKCDRERKFHRVKDRPAYDCDTCGYHLHPTAGTIFHKSPTSLHLWFYAMYLMASTRCGISAKQLERELGVTYKTAWRMFNLIRNEVMADDTEGPLSGSVEADETWHGGRMRQSDKRKAVERGVTIGPHAKKRETVFAVVQRGGRVVAMHVPSRYGHTLRKNLLRHVEPGSTVYPTTTPATTGSTTRTRTTRSTTPAASMPRGTSTRRPSRASSRCSRTACAASTTPSLRSGCRAT